MRPQWMTRTTARVAVAWLIGMAIAAAASAQSAEKISNIDAAITQVVTMRGSDGLRDQVAQAFTTGPATMGWALEKVVLYVGDWPANTADVEVTIHDASGTTIGSKLRDMTPGSTSTGLVSWTPNMPVTLTGETAYYVKAYNTTTGTLNQDWLRLRAIQGDGENAGGATGWEIANDRLDREGTGPWGANGWSIQMAVHAREINPPPTVSIEVTEGHAMPYFAYPVWTLTLSEVPATDLSVGLSFASSPAGVGNYLDAGASDTITVPAGQTTVKQRFPITMYTGTTPGTVTATVDAGTGYTVAAAPDNEATAYVSARAKLLITTVPADTQRTVTEGDRYEFSLTWQTATGLPKPTERILFGINLVSTAETASSNTDTHGPDDYEHRIVGATSSTDGRNQNLAVLEPGDWTPSAGGVERPPDNEAVQYRDSRRQRGRAR